MVRLERMTPMEFNQFRQFSVENYAKSLTRNLKVTYRAALEMARTESEEALPHGFYSEGHYFYTIVATTAEAEKVGYVWYVINHKRHSAFLYDLYIDAEHRGKGMAKAVMQQVEQYLRKAKVKHFRLNVFADNIQARQLYDSMGFEPSNTIMQKQL